MNPHLCEYARRWKKWDDARAAYEAALMARNEATRELESHWNEWCAGQDAGVYRVSDDEVVTVGSYDYPPVVKLR